MTPSPYQTGTFTLDINVSDLPGHPKDHLKLNFKVVLKISGYNRPPVIKNMGVISAIAGRELRLNIEASDPDGDPVTITAQNLPSGAVLNNKTLVWTPARVHAGKYTNIVIIATDGKARALMNLAIYVNWPASSKAPSHTEKYGR
jgi:hypothetical protein